jgi:nucleotide-binding universal stress UspA family protein
MRIKHFIFPVDFSRKSVEVCPYVTAVTRRFGAKLSLLHVVDDFPRGSTALDRRHTEDEAEMKARKEHAEWSLAEFERQYIPNLATEARVLVGDPAQTIVTFAGEHEGRAILMPTHGYGPFRSFLLGSVTAKVLHDAQCPVWTGPHLEEQIDPAESFGLRRILCAVSLDWETDRILQASSELAGQLGAELTAFTVVAPFEYGAWPGLDPSSEPPLSTHSARSALQEALYRAGVLARACISVGEVSREVARAAQAHNSDLVVIGRGGSPNLPGRLGSRAYAIVRRSPCSVLRV